MHAIHLTDWDAFLLQRAILIAVVQRWRYSRHSLAYLHEVYGSLRSGGRILRITPYSRDALGMAVQRLQEYDEQDDDPYAKDYDPHDYTELKNKIRKELY